MVLLDLLLRDRLNTRIEWKKRLNDQAIVEPLFYTRRQNHNSFRKVCLNFVIIHYIFSYEINLKQIINKPNEFWKIYGLAI